MKYSIAAILILLSIRSAPAQITLTSDDFIAYSFGVPSMQAITFTTNDTGLQTLETINGSDQTWNFSGRKYTVQGFGSSTVSLVPYPGGAPFANDADFASATHVYEITSSDPTQTSIYTFVRIDPTGLWVLGSSQDSMGVLSKQTVANPPYQFYKFPMTYGTSWSYSTVIWNANFTPDTESANFIVDGWGTLITPPSNSNPTLRLNENVTINGFSSYTYYWFTKSFYSAQLDAESDLTPEDAQYSEPTGNGVNTNQGLMSGSNLNMLLSQNPMSNANSELFYTLKSASTVCIELMDALGRSVQMLQNARAHAGQNIIPIDASSLTNGSYFVRVTSPEGSAMQKFVVEK